jgi:hypothetical protein
MVTEQTCTVYNCAACGAPAYFSSVHREWFHYGTKTARPDGQLCAAVTPVPVRLPVTGRDS